MLFAAFVATVMLFGCADERVGWELIPRRVTPLAIESGASSDGAAAWALFDRDTASAWRPTAGGEPITLTITLDREQSISALKVFGASGYRLSVASGEDASEEEGEPTEIDLSVLGSGWNILPLTAPRSTDRLRLDFTPTGAQRAVSELEIWAGATALESRVEARSLADRVAAGRPLPEQIEAVRVDAKAVTLKPESSATRCGTWAFSLARHPSVYRRAWMSFTASGMFRPFVLTRTLNDGPTRHGQWVGGDWKSHRFADALDTAALRHGENQFTFCLPNEANAPVTLQAAHFIGELDTGTDLVESVQIGSATKQTAAPRLLDPNHGDARALS